MKNCLAIPNTFSTPVSEWDHTIKVKNTTKFLQDDNILQHVFYWATVFAVQTDFLFFGLLHFGSPMGQRLEQLWQLTFF